MKIEEMVIEAINKNELNKVLLGTDKYRLEVSSFIGANVPTDWPNIMRAGIYKVYKDQPNLDIKEKFESAIEILLSKNVFEIYVAISVIFFQIISEENKTSPFKINRERIIGIVKNVLVHNKSEMNQYFDWMGGYYKNGMWGEMERINSILEEDYNITIL